MASPHDIARATLSEELAALEKRKSQIAIVEGIISSLTEEQLEALMTLSSLCQKAGAQRMRELQIASAREKGYMGNHPAGSVFTDTPNI